MDIAGHPRATQLVNFAGDVVGFLAVGLCIPLAVLLVGTPVVLVVRLLLEVLERL